MLQVGTYNAIIAANEFYRPAPSNFASSHKTFKRMMPTFAWEVLEVYSGPPQVSFRWRHWGEFKNDYVGFNEYAPILLLTIVIQALTHCRALSKGEKVRVKAHGGPIDVQGVTVATVNEKVQLQKVETWFDPMEMFRQMVKGGGVVTKEPVTIPADVGATEPKEAAIDSTSEAMAITSLNETTSLKEETSTNTAATNVAKDRVEGNKIPQKSTIEKGRIEPEENGTGSAEHLPAPATSHSPELQSDLSVSDIKTHGNTHTIREEVNSSEEVLASVQTVAEKELDVDLAEEKGKAGVYQSSGCPFLVTTADQNVLNRE